jgi:hypothetical protein
VVEEVVGIGHSRLERVSLWFVGIVAFVVCLPLLASWVGVVPQLPSTFSQQEEPPLTPNIELNVVPEWELKAAPSTEDASLKFAPRLEAYGSFECKIDSGAWEECTSPQRYENLEFGVEHTFTVRTDTGTLVAEESWISSLTTKPRPRGTAFIDTWHPWPVEYLLSLVGISWFGHEHVPREPKVVGDVLIAAPVTTCWAYDLFEYHCDGPDHYKSFLDGTSVGAYKGDTSLISPARSKACGYNEVSSGGLSPTARRTYCVSDYRFDNTTIWIDVGRTLKTHTAQVGCPGPRSLTYPCTARYS